MAPLTNNDETGSLANDQESEEVEIAEEELIDAYVRNELSADERKILEKGLLNSSRLVERLHFSRLLAAEVAPAPQQQASSSELEADGSVALSDPKRVPTSWWKVFFGPSFAQRPAFRLALAACVILIFFSGAALLAGWMKLRGELNRLAAERTAIEQQKQELERQSAENRSNTNHLTAELQRVKEQQAADQKRLEELQRALKQNEQAKQPGLVSTMASILLSPGLTRGTGGGNELILSPGASTVTLQLELESADYPSYRAVIKDSQGVQITETGLKPRRSRSGKILLVQIPANHLPPGDYTVRVSGITSSGAVEDVHDYAFRVRRKQE